MSSEITTQLEQEATKNMYERLIAARDKNIKNLENFNSVTLDIQGSKMFQEVFCCNDPLYKDQIQIIKDTVPNVINDDTVGKYLYGCFQTKSTVEISCTPSCNSGLKNPELSLCDLASYEKRGTLRRVNGVNSEDAYIFIASGNELTVDDRKELYREGIKVITLYQQDGNTIDYLPGETINVLGGYQSNVVTITNTTLTTTNTSNWPWVWILLATILIIIIVLLMNSA